MTSGIHTHREMRQDSDVVEWRSYHASDTTDRQKARSAEAATCGTGSHATVATPHRT